jgi:hypothetical protein
MDTRPPIFKKAIEPLEADEWINTMEQKFRLVRLSDDLKIICSAPIARTYRDVMVSFTHRLP